MHNIKNMKTTSSLHTSPLFLAFFFLLITASLSKAIPARLACNGTIAECDNGDKEWLMDSDSGRRLLQMEGNSLSSKSLQPQAACIKSNGTSYTNNCFPVNN
ncbi:hypothetical protein QJS10_CPB04g01291 [Acorus calamus]|uniref:Uncharacterized protein n=1 Tax=Acorus calamus TaxID=4465 RepID=A0AAV9EYR1_ACOCL|nr:hypothetical protein QJS10_CPB04g01291 [Acorus calamus]